MAKRFPTPNASSVSNTVSPVCRHRGNARIAAISIPTLEPKMARIPNPSLRMSLAIVSFALLVENVISIDGGRNLVSPEEMMSWFNLIRILIGLCFITIGSIRLCYGHFATSKFLKRYQTDVIRIHGEVLKCEEMPDSVNKYQIQVLYAAPTKSDPLSPEMDAEYVKHFDAHCLALPGASSVQLLLLKDLPRSACTEDMIEAKIQQCSHSYTGFLLIPGSILAAAFIYLSVLEIQQIGDRERWIGWLVLYGCLTTYVWLGLSVADNRFQEKANATYLNAIRVRRHIL